MHYFDQKEVKELEQLRGTDSFVDQVLQDLDRIMQSEHFKRIHAEARRFLGFVVAATLLGRSDTVKESIIAINAYHHAPGEFNPLESRKISVAAGGLRERLARYYATEGKNDPTKIVIPVGTFVPEIHDRRVSVEVTDFANWHLAGEEEHLCQTVSAEIVHCLNETGWIRASRSYGELGERASHQYRVGGSLVSCAGRVMIHFGLDDLNTEDTPCWECLKASRHEAMKLAREAADVLIDALRDATDRLRKPPSAA